MCRTRICPRTSGRVGPLPHLRSAELAVAAALKQVSEAHQAEMEGAVLRKKNACARHLESPLRADICVAEPLIWEAR